MGKGKRSQRRELRRCGLELAGKCRNSLLVTPLSFTLLFPVSTLSKAHVELSDRGAGKGEMQGVGGKSKNGQRRWSNRTAK